MQEITLPGFEGQKIEVRLSNAMGSAKLFVNGQPAPAGPKRNQFALQRNDGTTVIAQFKPSFPDPVPSLLVGEQTIRLAEPLQWYQWVWAAFPISLLFVGGMLGALLGMFATTINASILRSNQPVVLRYVFSGLVSILAFGLWIGLVLMIRR